MIAGVGGIDLGMLVVAADDGPMPQTLEHLDVLRLLGLRQFVAVISKTDRVPPERVEQVCTEVRQLLADTDHELFTVSNSTGEGILALKTGLEQRALQQLTHNTQGNFRMSVDRSFLLKGIGLVVTGTATAGEVKINDELQLLPQGITVRVRSMRVHDSEASSGRAGQRCALNLSGPIEKSHIARGDILTAATNAPMELRFDARFRLLPNAPFAVKHRAPVKLHIGAKHVEARLYIIDETDGSRLQPGAEALVQLISSQPLPSCRGDRFLLRDHSESVTLGGGMVLDPLAPRSGKGRERRRNYLKAMANDDVEQALTQLLATSQQALNLGDLSRSWNLRAHEIEPLKSRPGVTHFTLDNADYLIATEHWQAAYTTLARAVPQWHATHPDKTGIKASALLLQLQDSMSSSLYQSVLSAALQSGELSLIGGLVQSKGYQPKVSGPDQQRWQTLETIFQQRAGLLPLVSELMTATGWDKSKVLDALHNAQRAGLVVKLNDNRYGLPLHLLEHAQKVLALEAGSEAISVINYKNAIGAGRKLSIEILEYFDTLRFTQRRGEQRVIINATLPEKQFTQ